MSCRIKVGLIGYGNWGKILFDKLINMSDLQFVCNSKDDYKSKLNSVEWVFVATPDATHYAIVYDCITAGKNVFCEKPLTLNLSESKILYDYAKKKGVKLYVDDIQNFRKYNFKITKNNFIERLKDSSGSMKNVLMRLSYHDIYVLYPYLKNNKMTDIILHDKTNKLHFSLFFGNKKFEFLYDINSKIKKHEINKCDLTGDDDILSEMLYKVLHNQVNYTYNKQITLFTNKILDKISEKIFPKIAVVGGGIFGCTTAWMLAEEGHDVDLFEKNNDIMTQASFINQYRLHRGYHYPRSKDTAKSSIEGERTFLQKYGDAVMGDKIKHYYCIAKKDSLLSAGQYLSFLKELNLFYEEKTVDLIHKNVVDLTIKVQESLFNSMRLKQICWDKLNNYNVNVKLNTKYISGNYDYIINATYTNLNELLPDDKQKKYQFELCEKPVIQLPKKYKNISIVIMDGPFMCIDPLGNTGYHVMGNVVHAIHNTHIGKSPKYNLEFDKLLNKGIVKNPAITNINKFIKSASVFFKDINKAKHIGSMFTHRTVLPNRDKDDARPTLVERVNDKFFNLFSGKIGTCVDAANQIKEYINK